MYYVRDGKTGGVKLSRAYRKPKGIIPVATWAYGERLINVLPESALHCILQICGYDTTINPIHNRAEAAWMYNTLKERVNTIGLQVEDETTTALCESWCKLAKVRYGDKLQTLYNAGFNELKTLLEERFGEFQFENNGVYLSSE